MKTRQGIETKKDFCYRENKAFQWKLFIKRTGSLKFTKNMWEKHHTECVFGDNNLTFIYSTFQPDGLQSASQALVLV